jgi:hypothetical protein
MAYEIIKRLKENNQIEILQQLETAVIMNTAVQVSMSCNKPEILFLFIMMN